MSARLWKSSLLYFSFAKGAKGSGFGAIRLGDHEGAGIFDPGDVLFMGAQRKSPLILGSFGDGFGFKGFGSPPKVLGIGAGHTVVVDSDAVVFFEVEVFSSMGEVDVRFDGW